MPDLNAQARGLAPRRIVAFIQAPLPLLLGVGLALLIEFFVRPRLGPFYAEILIAVGINILLAVSLNIVNGFTGQFSIGHAGFMALGAYAAAGLTYYGSFRLWGSADVHGGFLGAGQGLFLASLIAGGLVAAAAGYVVGLPSLRLRGDYLAIVTLGFGEIVRIVMQQSPDTLSLDDLDEIRRTPFPKLLTHLGGALGFDGLPDYTSLFWTYSFVALVLLVSLRLKLSTQGRAFLALRENEIAAQAVGVPVTRYKVRAFVLSAFFAGIAGGLYAHNFGTVLRPEDLGFQKSIDVVIMVVLGGMGSITGSLIAAVVLTLLPELLRSVEGYRMIVYALLLIGMMIVRPQGLMGVKEFWEISWLKNLWRRPRQIMRDTPPPSPSGRAQG